MTTNKIHRYEKLENSLKALIKFNENSENTYKWLSYGIFRKALSRAIEDTPGYIDTTIIDIVDEILDIREHTPNAILKVKELAQQALNEIAWEKKTGNDLYPCIEID